MPSVAVPMARGTKAHTGSGWNLGGDISHSITTVAKDNYIIEIEDEED